MTPSGQTVCLCMIVKDEAPVIRRCLDSAHPLVDRWLIVDTGSTDGTQAIVREHFRDVPGELVERPWRDFAHNRSEALALARPLADYSLIVDADDAFEAPAGYALPVLDADSYVVDIRDGGITYPRPQLVKNALPWRYAGVLHEFLTCEGAESQGHLALAMRRNHDGARRRNPDTYRKDAALLERALETEQDAFLRSRYTFYLAQSYRDCGEPENSLRHYLARADLGFWDQEVFVALLQAGRTMEHLGRPLDDVLAVYGRATNACPWRAEALHAAAKLCRVAGENVRGTAFGAAASVIPLPSSGLFLEPWVYQWGALDEYAINSYWSGKHRESGEACLRLLERDDLPPDDRRRIVANARFTLDRLTEKPSWSVDGLTIWPSGSPIETIAPQASPAAAPGAALVSIVTPTRDRAGYLEQAFGYVLGQTYGNVEWLVLDTSDEPFHGASELAAAGFSYEHLPRAMTIGEKRNHLIARARGEIIVQMDDDDYYAPDYVATMVASLAEKGADLINLRGWFLYDRRSDFFGYWNLERKEGFHYRCDRDGIAVTMLGPDNNSGFADNHRGFGFGYVFRRSVWDRVKFPAIDWNEDGVFASEAAKIFKLDGVHDTEGLCLHVLHGQSTSRCFPQYRFPSFSLSHVFPTALVEAQAGSPTLRFGGAARPNLARGAAGGTRTAPPARADGAAPQASPAPPTAVAEVERLFALGSIAEAEARLRAVGDGRGRDGPFARAMGNIVRAKRDLGLPALVWRCGGRSADSADWIQELLAGVRCSEGGSDDGAEGRHIIVCDDLLTPEKRDFYVERAAKGCRIHLIHLGGAWTGDDTGCYELCASVFRTQWSPAYETLKHVVTIPLGYRRGFHVDPADRASADRPLLWSFAGRPRSGERPAMLRALGELKPHRVHPSPDGGPENGLSQDDYRQLLQRSLFAPCPSGTTTRDTSRLYEALEAGCIPIVERGPEYDYHGAWLGPHPFLAVRDWRQVPELIGHILASGRTDKLRDDCLTWWSSTKRLYQDVVAKHIG